METTCVNSPPPNPRSCYIGQAEVLPALWKAEEADRREKCSLQQNLFPGVELKPWELQFQRDPWAASAELWALPDYIKHPNPHQHHFQPASCHPRLIGSLEYLGVSSQDPSDVLNCVLRRGILLVPRFGVGKHQPGLFEE